VARQQERHLSHGWPTGKAGGTELWPHEAELGREAKGRGEPEVDSTSGQERKEDNERGRAVPLPHHGSCSSDPFR
jgi:hypothetical protein